MGLTANALVGEAKLLHLRRVKQVSPVEQDRRRHRFVQGIIRKESRHPGFQVARIFERRLSAGEKPDGGP